MKRKIAFITILILIMPVLVFAQASTVERQYHWFAEEKLTISNSVVQLSSEEYDYFTYGLTRINVKDPNVNAFVLNEVVSDNTTGAMGLIRGYSAATSPSYLDIEILYNGLDSADWDANDTISAAGGGGATVTGTYTRGNIGLIIKSSVAIAEIHMLDNSIIWTRNGATPVYSATDSACVGRKQYEGDTFYLFGTQQITAFKALRNGSSDAIIHVRYGQ